MTRASCGTGPSGGQGQRGGEGVPGGDAGAGHVGQQEPEPGGGRRRRHPEPSPLADGGAGHLQLAAVLAAVQPRPPPVGAEGDVHDLEPAVGVQAVAGEQQEEERRVGDAQRPVGDVLAGHQPHAQRPGAERRHLPPGGRRAGEAERRLPERAQRKVEVRQERRDGGEHRRPPGVRLTLSLTVLTRVQQRGRQYGRVSSRSGSAAPRRSGGPGPPCTGRPCGGCRRPVYGWKRGWPESGSCRSRTGRRRTTGRRPTTR